MGTARLSLDVGVSFGPLGEDLFGILYLAVPQLGGLATNHLDETTRFPIRAADADRKELGDGTGAAEVATDEA